VKASAAPVVKLSHPVVEAGLYDAPRGSALVLANFTYEPISGLSVEAPLIQPATRVRSLAHGDLPFELKQLHAESAGRNPGYTHVARFVLPQFGHDDLVLIETEASVP
jgi:hypothetical protein